jgi:release factor glutamine methyltransferase
MTQTLGAVLAAAAAEFSAAGCIEPRRRARQLIAAALCLSPTEFLAHTQRKLAEREVQHARRIVRRAVAGEPSSRVLGRREFWGFEFALSAATLDPRPESETVVEAVLRRIPRRDVALRLLDLGSGTGCLLLALLGELPAATGVAVDIAPGAATTARTNAVALGLGSRAQFFVGDWAAALAERYSVVVANPPYIVRDALSDLPQAVRRHDPSRALDGGTDGLEAYRVIVPDLIRLLSSDGLFVAEVGSGQADAVAGLVESAGLKIDAVEHDYGGIARCVVARRPFGVLRLRRGSQKIVGNCDHAV